MSTTDHSLRSSLTHSCASSGVGDSGGCGGRQSANNVNVVDFHLLPRNTSIANDKASANSNSGSSLQDDPKSQFINSQSANSACYIKSTTTTVLPHTSSPSYSTLATNNAAASSCKFCFFW